MHIVAGLERHTQKSEKNKCCVSSRLQKEPYMTVFIASLRRGRIYTGLQRDATLMQFTHHNPTVLGAHTWYLILSSMFRRDAVVWP